MWESAENCTAEYLGYIWNKYEVDYYIDLLCIQLKICVDVDYLRWLLWMIYPVIVIFLLPIVLLIFLYASVLFLQIYKYRHRLKEAYSRDIWDGARSTLGVAWEGFGKIWHGYEIDGLDKIPTHGPAVIIYYHAAIPIDVYFVLAKCQLNNGRVLRPVADHFLFKIPGFKLLLEVCGVFPGNVETCVDLLNQGNILLIAPGGLREAFFSDENYRLEWGKRTGFAKVALRANVPIIPMFTQNCREGYRYLSIGREWFRKLYEKTRLPILPIYGGFPVKLRTIIGDPINGSSNLTQEQLAKLVRSKIEQMIRDNQQVPGSILRGLLQRVTGLLPVHISEENNMNSSRPKNCEG